MQNLNGSKTPGIYSTLISQMIFAKKLSLSWKSEVKSKVLRYRTRAKKGRGFYSKIIFSFLQNDAFWQNLDENAPTLGIFLCAAIIQERPLFARVR